MSPCIVGVGEPMAGDDAVGLRVVDELGVAGLAGVELFRLRDPSELVDLLPGRVRALVVDARLDPEHAGRVDLLEVPPGGLPRGALGTPLSSHGVDTLTAIELGRTLARAEPFPSVSLLTIAIARPDRLGERLSATASRAVLEAAARARAWLDEVGRA